MLGDISRLEKIHIVCGYTDICKSIDIFCSVIEDQLKMDPSSSALFLKSSYEKVLQVQVDYLTKKLFSSSSERRSDEIPRHQNLFDKAEMERDPSLLEKETVIKEHTRKKKAVYKDLFKGIKVEKSSDPSSGRRTNLSSMRHADGPDRRGIYPPGSEIYFCCL